MSKDIGVGVIGLGMGSGMFALNQTDSSRMEVRAICSQSPARLREAAQRWRVPTATTDYRELVARPDIDVVAVYSPDHLHFEHAMAALRAGKHVLCTKPMTNDLDQAMGLVAAVRETGLKFLVGQTMRYDPQMAAAKRFCDDGDLGKVLFAEAHYLHDMRPVFAMTPWRLTTPQDFMYGGVSHPVDVLRWFLGDIVELHAFGSRSGLTPEYSLMDNFTLNLRFADGTIGRALGLYGVVEPSEPMMKLILYGTKMTITATYADNVGGQLKLAWDKVEYRPTATMPFPPERGLDVYGHTKSILRYMAHLEDCIINDREPSPSVYDGAKTVSAGAAAWQSIKEDRVIQVFNGFV